MKVAGRMLELKRHNAVLARKNEKLRAALEKAVADYGRPGGPWNIPSEPGTWLQMAKDALGGE